VQHAVDPQANSQSVLVRVKVHVGRVELEGPLEQEIDEGSGTDNVNKLSQFFL
jgi:hypothetical protein